jgi:hypothetical protein
VEQHFLLSGDARTLLADFFDRLLVVEDDIEEGTVHVQSAVVVDEASLRIVFIERLAISTSVRNDSARFKGCGQTVF